MTECNSLEDSMPCWCSGKLSSITSLHLSSYFLRLLIMVSMEFITPDVVPSFPMWCASNTTMLCSPPSLIFNANDMMFVCALEASSVNAYFHSKVFSNWHATSPSHAILIFLRQLHKCETLEISFVTTSFANAWECVAMFSATTEGLVPVTTERKQSFTKYVFRVIYWTCFFI